MFWISRLLFAASATFPAVVPLEDKIAANVVVGALPLTIEFLIVTLLAPLEALALPTQTTTDVVPVFVFSKVKF